MVQMRVAHSGDMEMACTYVGPCARATSGFKAHLQSTHLLFQPRRQHCRGPSFVHLGTTSGLLRTQTCRSDVVPPLLSVRDKTSPDDNPLVLGVRSGDGGSKNGPSDFSSFFSNQAGTTEPGSVRESEVRARMVRKLSEANQYIRHLQRELQEKNQTLLSSRSDLAAMEMELQVLVEMAQEVAKESIIPGTRKINGRYLHSHLAYRLEELQKVTFARIKDVDLVRTRDIRLTYYEMAEGIRVMGSFDGWSSGEQMSPESTGTRTKFTTTLKLRPGQYEIKFLVDGNWHVSPELPTIGEGLTMNNLLIVDQT